MRKGKHYHVCENCAYLFSHTDEEALASEKDPHRCPQCDCGPYRQAYSADYAAKLCLAFLVNDFLGGIMP